MSEKSFFYQIWGVVNFGFRGSEAPKRPILERNPKRPLLGPFLGPFAAGKILVRREKKIGPLLGPSGARMCHMSIFLTKKYFFAPACFLAVENSQKGPKSRPGWLPYLQQCSGNTRSTVNPGPGPRTRRSQPPPHAGAVQCTQPADPPEIVFYAQGYYPGPPDHQRSGAPYSAAFTQHVAQTNPHGGHRIYFLLGGFG